MSVESSLPPFPVNTYRGYVRHDFQLAETSVTLVEPRHPEPGRRWIWRAEFFDAFPAFDLEMLGRGWWLAYMNVGNTFGCPSAMDRFDLFYEELTGKYGFHRRPVLEGLSRGGLYVYNWAARNPEKIGLIYADNPVCDFKSWPGGFGNGPGSEADWAALLRCYGFDSEAEALAWTGNPLDQAQIIVGEGIPLVHVYGDADEVVPWDENTGAMRERVRSLGGAMKTFLKPGALHHPHGPENPAELADWVVRHARD